MTPVHSNHTLHPANGSNRSLIVFAIPFACLSVRVNKDEIMIVRNGHYTKVGPAYRKSIPLLDSPSYVYSYIYIYIFFFYYYIKLTRVTIDLRSIA